MDDRNNPSSRAAAHASGAGGADPGSARAGGSRDPAEPAPARSLTWSEAETMDILADGDMMKSIAEGIEDVKAGRLVPWKPRSAQCGRPA